MRTSDMLEAVGRQLFAKAAELRREGEQGEIVACVLDEPSGLALLVDRKARVVQRLRTEVAPSPRSTIQAIETEPAQSGQLRVVTMSREDGWGTHWIALAVGPYGDA